MVQANTHQVRLQSVVVLGFRRNASIPKPSRIQESSGFLSRKQGQIGEITLNKPVVRACYNFAEVDTGVLDGQIDRF